MEVSGGPSELKEGGERRSGKGSDFGVNMPGVPGGARGAMAYTAPSLMAESVDALMASALPVTLVLPEYTSSVFSSSARETDDCGV